MGARMPNEPGRLQKGLLRYVASLLNRCPHWVAAPASGQDCILARSPSGVHYRIEAHTSLSKARAVLAAGPRPNERLILILLSEAPQDLALPAGVHLWTLSELDYLIMAADLESNAPLAHLGLEVEPPQVALSTHTPIAQRATQGY